MSSSPPPSSSLGYGPRNVPLVIKDSLRELRFSMNLGAKRWMEGIEDIVENIPKIGAPLGAATKTASHLLQLADRAAVDLLSTQSPFRRADFCLPSPDFYVVQDDGWSKSKLFIKNHYWALKHLLKLKNRTEFLVLEESIFQALQYFEVILTHEAKQLANELIHQPPASESSIVGARIIYSLYRSRPLSLHFSNSQGAERMAESTAALTLQVCVSAVLASQITALLPSALVQIETREALRLADEVCGARLESWEAAMLHRNPVQRMAQELDFTLRHL